jgi:hypothetical protein
MADSDSHTEDEAARRAADVAAELSETDTAEDRRRVARALGAVARSAARTVRRGTTIARRDSGAVAPVDDGRKDGIVWRGTRVVRRSAGLAASTFAMVVTWLTGQVMAMGPRLKIRDTETLRGQFPGKTDDEIAELLIDHAARATGAVGGATGAWAALPWLPAFPAEIAAETLSITGIEIKLVAELHEVYGLGVTGTATERGRAYIASWAHRRGVYMVPGGLLLVGASPLAGQVRRRLAARVRRSAFSLAPLFTGAVAGVMINSRETQKLGGQIRDDLRRHRLTSLSVTDNAASPSPAGSPAHTGGRGGVVSWTGMGSWAGTGYGTPTSMTPARASRTERPTPLVSPSVPVAGSRGTAASGACPSWSVPVKSPVTRRRQADSLGASVLNRASMKRSVRRAVAGHVRGHERVHRAVVPALMLHGPGVRDVVGGLAFLRRGILPQPERPQVPRRVRAGPVR